tara:strand:+ start:243 stop:563 length:321 start_codon:yes stop_codon:yes gene_type:complete
MGLQLTVIKTKSEHWERCFGFPQDFIKLEFSSEHELKKEGNLTVIQIAKKTELYQAFNTNMNNIFHLGMERAMELVFREIDDDKLDKKLAERLKKRLSKRIEQENF